MTVKRRFSLDTNILGYAVDRNAGTRHKRPQMLMGQAARCNCVLTVQALAEFLHAATRKELLEPERASAFVRNWLGVCQVTADDDGALGDALDAVEEHHLSFWDAMLWAWAPASRSRRDPQREHARRPPPERRHSHQSLCRRRRGNEREVATTITLASPRQ